MIKGNSLRQVFLVLSLVVNIVIYYKMSTMSGSDESLVGFLMFGFCSIVFTIIAFYVKDRGSIMYFVNNFTAFGILIFQALLFIFLIHQSTVSGDEQLIGYALLLWFIYSGTVCGILFGIGLLISLLKKYFDKNKVKTKNN